MHPATVTAIVGAFGALVTIIGYILRHAIKDETASIRKETFDLKEAIQHDLAEARMEAARETSELRKSIQKDMAVALSEAASLKDTVLLDREVIKLRLNTVEKEISSIGNLLLEISDFKGQLRTFDERLLAQGGRIDANSAKITEVERREREREAIERENLLRELNKERTP